MRLYILVIALALCLCGVSTAYAVERKFDYGLSAVKVAQDTYIFEGLKEDFSFKNGGNIVNTGFIVTSAGVLVIDSGVSRRYAEQQRAAIRKVTDKPVIAVYLTHHHPDHFLGNQVYTDVKIYSLVDTANAIRQEGEGFSSNMYRLVGDWMRGTEVTLPTEAVKPGVQTIGEHKLQFMALDGHTGADLAIYDHTTGVLFAGDLVFNHRTATTPHANIDKWLKTLDELKKIPFKVLVAGHGGITTDTTAIEQTKDYLTWLQDTLKQAAGYGMDMNEISHSEIPARFKSLSLVRVELSRSVTHLYPAIERDFLDPINH
jgi:uncharacterized sulfatase